MSRKQKELPDFLEAKLKAGLTRDEQYEFDDLRRTLYQKRGGDISHPLLDALRDLKRRCRTTAASVYDEPEAEVR